jgi:hypothetical protein
MEVNGQLHAQAASPLDTRTQTLLKINRDAYGQFFMPLF